MNKRLLTSLRANVFLVKIGGSMAKVMNIESLDATARALVAAEKGILAADESFGTIKKRFEKIGLESNAESRRAYRQLLLSCDGAENFISGVILFDETIRQQADDGTPFPKVLEATGILPGIKVDGGAKPFAGHPGEMLTEGLDGLRDRLAEYRDLGARFAKWRAVIGIEGRSLPTGACVRANAHALAIYAALCQEEGIVPMVEPEVLMEGDHGIERCEEVTEEVLAAVFARLHDYGVRVEGMILKPNMVIAGMACPRQAGPEEVAEKTIRCLRRVVPAAVPGVAFLSGGQNPELATLHLNEMNRRGPHPWELSFSFGRALQEPSLDAWQGKAENVARARELLSYRAELNSRARSGNGG